MIFTLIEKNNYLIITNENNENVFMCSKEDSRISFENTNPKIFKLFDIYNIASPLKFKRIEILISGGIIETDDLLYTKLDSITGDNTNNTKTNSEQIIDNQKIIDVINTSILDGGLIF